MRVDKLISDDDYPDEIMLNLDNGQIVNFRILTTKGAVSAKRFRDALALVIFENQASLCNNLELSLKNSRLWSQPLKERTL